MKQYGVSDGSWVLFLLKVIEVETEALKLIIRNQTQRTCNLWSRYLKVKAGSKRNAIIPSNNLPDVPIYIFLPCALDRIVGLLR